LELIINHFGKWIGKKRLEIKHVVNFGIGSRTNLGSISLNFKGLGG
jgi:hypothetical protein